MIAKLEVWRKSWGNRGCCLFKFYQNLFRKTEGWGHFKNESQR